MNFAELKNKLSDVIERNLISRIGKKCVLLDVPYYTNIGDTLIWEGTSSLLKKHGIKCSYITSCSNFKYKKLSPDTTILMQGGGNFGDIWRAHQEFRMKITELYPNNPIIVLPQTIYYEDERVMAADAELMNKHKNLTICARDNVSLKLLNRYFTDSTNLLVPDMAYCISDEILNKYRVESDPNLALYLKRIDKEFNSSISADSVLSGENREIESRDWPSMESDSVVVKRYYRLARRNRKWHGLLRGVIDWYMCNIFREALVKQGIEFVSKYSAIYTTRLHVAILASLLQKPFTFINNSYGKNKQFYESWMAECDEIQFKE